MSYYRNFTPTIILIYRFYLVTKYQLSYPTQQYDRSNIGIEVSRSRSLGLVQRNKNLKLKKVNFLCYYIVVEIFQQNSIIYYISFVNKFIEREPFVK